MNPIKLLVTGTSGQVVTSLVAAGARSLRTEGFQPTNAAIVVTSVGRTEFDLCQPPMFARLLSDYAPDVVVNAAAYTAVDRAEGEQEAAFAANAAGAGALADACACRIG